MMFCFIIHHLPTAIASHSMDFPIVSYRRVMKISLPAIYLTTNSRSHHNSDVWQVNVNGLDIEPDYDDHDSTEYGEWWAYYSGDIPPSRLKLYHTS